MILNIRYGVAHLNTPLLFIMGHGSCGAVTAAVDYVKKGEKLDPGTSRYVGVYICQHVDNSPYKLVFKLRAYTHSNFSMINCKGIHEFGKFQRKLNIPNPKMNLHFK
jgi:hypothetical protein